MPLHSSSLKELPLHLLIVSLLYRESPSLIIRGRKINLPTNLSTEVVHRYSANSFKLHRLPTPRPGQVLGLVGTNGIGKSTALKILSGKVKANLGRYDNPPDWEEILKYFRGSELQSSYLHIIQRGLIEANDYLDYFTKVLEDDLKAVVKPQYVDQIPKAVKGDDKTVQPLINARVQMDNLEDLLDILGQCSQCSQHLGETVLLT